MEDKHDPDFVTLPRYWVPEDDVPGEYLDEE